VVLLAFLTRSGTELLSVFELLGTSENNITDSIAWALAQSPSFLREFLQQTIGWTGGLDNVSIRLQTYDSHGGITDVEIEFPNHFFLIIEAKKGWILPDLTQLQKYSQRSDFVNSAAPIKRLFVMSECANIYAKTNLPVLAINNIPIEHISWTDIANYAKTAKQAGYHAEKRFIEELLVYLKGVMSMQNMQSNIVYVVSLSLNTEQVGKYHGQI